jgi:hypothetical protein
MSMFAGWLDKLIQRGRTTSGAETTNAVPEHVAGWGFDNAVLGDKGISITMKTESLVERTHPAHNLGTSTAFGHHISGAFGDLTTGQASGTSGVLAEQAHNRLDAVGNASSAVQHVRQCLDILILTTQSLLHQLLAIGRQIGVELTACPREGVQSIQVHRASNFLDDSVSAVSTPYRTRHWSGLVQSVSYG